MRFYLQQGQCGKVVPRPVAAFHGYNSAGFGAAYNGNTTAQIDTAVRDDGPVFRQTTAYNWDPTVEGDWVTFGSGMFDNWAGSEVYRSAFVSASNNIPVITGKGPAVIEQFMEGSAASAQCIGSVQRLTAPGGATNRVVFNQLAQASLPRNISANNARVGTVKINALTSRGVRVHRTSAQAFSAGVEAALSMQAETYDDDPNYWDVGTPTRLTVPTGFDGWYIIDGGCSWASVGSNVYRQCSIRLNGSTYLGHHIINGRGGTKQNHVWTLHYLAAGDYVELMGKPETAVSVVNTNGPYAHLGMLRVSRDDYPGACITRTSTQSIASLTEAVVSFNSVVRDNWGMSQVGGSNPERLTVPTGQAGWYLMVGNLRWAASTDNFNRWWYIRKNGGSQWESILSSLTNYATSNTPCGSVGAVLYLAEGDYITLSAENFHNTTAKDLQADLSFLSLVKVQQ